MADFATQNTKYEGPDSENTCAVIVTYHPGNALIGILDVVSSQVSEVLVVDNSAAGGTVGVLSEIAARHAAEMVFNPTNLGVAAGLNIGREWALKRGYRWMLALDQDSIVYSNALEVFANVYDTHDQPDKIAVIGANYIDKSVGAPLHMQDPGSGSWADQETVITSGSLISTEASKTIGPFRDGLFIDYVDDEVLPAGKTQGFSGHYYGCSYYGTQCWLAHQA